MWTPRRYGDSRRIVISAPAEDVFEVVSSCGGAGGWFSPQWMWWLRGAADRLCGGPGLAGRPDRELQVGDEVDFWVVGECERPRRLRLDARMAIIGPASLTWEITTTGPSTSVLTQTAHIDASRLVNRLYWLSLVPSHAVSFRWMLRTIAHRASHLAE